MRVDVMLKTRGEGVGVCTLVCANTPWRKIFSSRNNCSVQQLIRLERRLLSDVFQRAAVRNAVAKQLGSWFCVDLRVRIGRLGASRVFRVLFV
jgi:hypothetical protein